MKLDVHQHLIVIHFYLKFHEIHSVQGYLVIANYMEFKSIQILQLMNYQSQPDQT